jgi:hypothetical protein
MGSARAIGTSRPRAESEPYAARVLTAIALSSIAAGAINIAAAATIGSTAIDTLAFFVTAAAAQVVWGAVALVRAPRWWLALGAAGNLAVATTWVVSRTVGLPVGTYAGSVLPVGFPDGLATALEAAVVVGSVALLIRGASLTRAATRSPGASAATALVVGALALAGVLAQTGGIGSSSSGNEPGGGGGPSNGGYGY